MTEPREYTSEEIREQFFDHIDRLIEYWGSDDVKHRNTQERLEGLAFSFLTMLDGAPVNMLGGFRVFPNCHGGDPEYLKDQGENWWPPNEGESNLRGEITTMFHEAWCARDRKNKAG
jgi:hypothetical protein